MKIKHVSIVASNAGSEQYIIISFLRDSLSAEKSLIIPFFKDQARKLIKKVLETLFSLMKHKFKFLKLSFFAKLLPFRERQTFSPETRQGFRSDLMHTDTHYAPSFISDLFTSFGKRRSGMFPRTHSI